MDTNLPSSLMTKLGFWPWIAKLPTVRAMDGMAAQHFSEAYNVTEINCDAVKSFSRYRFTTNQLTRNRPENRNA
ncbi:hypothetical protein CEXT_194771 [Caerostris extrusa]|uniref:Uncharacterized protein n=1 Tax=Caerostris extrusa TaxID=172846 RepID=A0AAV4MCX7_CAEEX|nr:hypothetical protein CEXT_194771 [Caerostris extrusa]